MGNKKVNPLPEGFMDAFSSALDSQLAVDKTIKAPERMSDLEEEIQSIRRQITIAQQGGVGDVAKLSRRLAESQNALIEKKKRFEPSNPTGFRTADKVEVNGKTGYIRSLDKDNEKATVEFSKNDKQTVSFSDMKLSKTAGGVKVKEEADLEEAKMSDAEVLSAAKKLAANGKDEKTKKFGQGLVDFHKNNDSFTPDQVAGLQNIMKNASFQMAKEETDLTESKMDPVGKSDADIDNDGDVDSSDNYLHKRRKAIGKAIKRSK